MKSAIVILKFAGLVILFAVYVIGLVAVAIATSFKRPDWRETIGEP